MIYSDVVEVIFHISIYTTVTKYKFEQISDFQVFVQLMW